MDISTLFQSHQLKLIRELDGISKSELARDLGKSPAIITCWENGSRKPTKANVNELCLRFGVPAEYFACASPEEPVFGVNPFFRSLRTTTKRLQLQSRSYIGCANRVVEEYEKVLEFPRLNLPNLENETPESAAQKLRCYWNLDAEIDHLLRLLELNGIVVMFGNSCSKQIDAFSDYSNMRPLIVLNPAKRDYYRQRFDLAHELGHILLHNDSELGSMQIEREADRFAAEFLMPRALIYDQLPTKMGAKAWGDLKELKEKWGVSIQALLFRCKELGAISENSYRNSMITLSKRGWRTKEPGQRKVLEQPSILPAANEIQILDCISNADFALQCGIPERTLLEIVRKVPVAEISA